MTSEQVVELPEHMKSILRPHEQRLVARQMAMQGAKQAQSRLGAKELGKGLGGVLRGVQQLHVTQANWSTTPQSGIQCEQCKGLGYLLPKLTLRNQRHREAYHCPDCQEEQRERYREQVRAEIRQKWIAKRWLMRMAQRKIELAHLEEESDAHATLTAAFNLARGFAADMPKGGILSFDGPPGTAKTHLLAKIYRFCWLKGLSCIYLTGSDLQQHLTDFSRDGSGNVSLYKIKVDLCSADMLLIDEADRISIKDGFGWTENELLDVIEKRINYGKPTALAGNRLSRLLKPVLSRCESAGSYMLDMSAVPDGRGYFQGDGDWYEKALTGVV